LRAVLRRVPVFFLRAVMLHLGAVAGPILLAL
jgi:hypothetical protein